MKHIVNSVQVVAIYVSDLERALAFYRDTLGLQEGGEMAPGRLLQAGETTVYIEGGRVPAEPAGLKHPACSVCFGAESLRAAWEHLQAKQVPVIEAFQQMGQDFAFFRVADPDGNVVEFAGKP